MYDGGGVSDPDESTLLPMNNANALLVIAKRPTPGPTNSG